MNLIISIIVFKEPTKKIKTMKALKITGIILASILGVVIITGLILPKTIELEESVDINAPVDSVFVQVSHFSNFAEWSPWNEYDPDMQIKLEGTEGEVGSKYSWVGNEDVGTGSQTITALDKNKRIDIDLVFITPWESQSKIYYLFNGEGQSTTVTWGYIEKTKLPTNVIMAVMGVKKMLSEEFQKGLGQLKEIAEK